MNIWPCSRRRDPHLVGDITTNTTVTLRVDEITHLRTDILRIFRTHRTLQASWHSCFTDVTLGCVYSKSSDASRLLQKCGKGRYACIHACLLHAVVLITLDRWILPTFGAFASFERFGNLSSIAVCKVSATGRIPPTDLNNTCTTCIRCHHLPPPDGAIKCTNFNPYSSKQHGFAQHAIPIHADSRVPSQLIHLLTLPPLLCPASYVDERRPAVGQITV